MAETPVQKKHRQCPSWLSGQCHGGTCPCFPKGTPGIVRDEKPKGTPGIVRDEKPKGTPGIVRDEKPKRTVWKKPKKAT